MDIKLLVLLLVILSGSISCNPNHSNSKTNVKKGIITKVSDGDSVDFYDGKDTLKIRLQHIDAPERRQPYSSESWQYLRNRIYKKEVTLQYENTTDRYGRIIGTLFLNKQNINKLLVEKGYAWHFKRYSSDSSYADLERLARKHNKGLWKDKNPIPPWEWRK